jgi:Multicopper oxidase
MLKKKSFTSILITTVLITLNTQVLAERIDHSQHKQNTKIDHSQHTKQENKPAMNHDMHHGHHGHGDHNMSFDAEGMVMNSNDAILPKDCSKISQDYKITIKAGTHYSHPFPGNIFGFNQHEIKIKPCSRLEITFINEDEVRHQWMVHGLPKYIYDQGMFHLEASGGATKIGSIIVPSDNKTYLIHCDIAQHMEKGMKAQLVVGKGSGDLPSIPGISGPWLKP